MAIAALNQWRVADKAGGLPEVGRKHQDPTVGWEACGGGSNEYSKIGATTWRELSAVPFLRILCNLSSISRIDLFATAAADFSPPTHLYCGLACEALKIDSADWRSVVVHDGRKGSTVSYFKTLGHRIGHCERQGDGFVGRLSSAGFREEMGGGVTGNVQAPSASKLVEPLLGLN
ncbi:uncharacterized protein [Physcomitrium patens]|uniref:uncharacterized protein n=1 Tax=Physcomitrium patens TaxID=3218 RepID=UPI003CCE0695